MLREKLSQPFSPDVHPDFSGHWPSSRHDMHQFHSAPLRPLTAASPNFTESVSFLRCFGGLNLGQEYQQNAAGTNVQTVYLIRYSRRQ